VDRPAAYEWSSYGANALGAEDDLVAPHPVYQALGDGDTAQQAAYAATFATPLSPGLVQRVRDATNKAWVLGGNDFCREVEGTLNRRTQPQPRGGDRRSAAFRRALTERRTAAGGGS
jgi:putative transposase